MANGDGDFTDAELAALEAGEAEASTVGGVDWAAFAEGFAEYAFQGQVTPPKGGGQPGASTGEPWTATGQATLPRMESFWDQGVRDRRRVATPDMYESGFRPQYSTTYARNHLNQMTSAQLGALEFKMQQGGYFSDDDPLVGRGMRSLALVAQFNALITEADSNRVDWDQWLTERIRMKEEGELPEDVGRPGFAAPAYLKPDYDWLAQKVKFSVRDGLGREATSTEMELLTQYLGGAHKDQWQARQYNAGLAHHNALGRAAETGENQSAGTVQDSDWAASYAEMYESRYDAELGHRDRVAQTDIQDNSLFGSLDMISRAI